MPDGQPHTFTDQRITRRGAVRAGGRGAAALVSGAADGDGTAGKHVAAQDATPASG